MALYLAKNLREISTREGRREQSERLGCITYNDGDANQTFGRPKVNLYENLKVGDIFVYDYHGNHTDDYERIGICVKILKWKILSKDYYSDEETLVKKEAITKILKPDTIGLGDTDDIVQKVPKKKFDTSELPEVLPEITQEVVENQIDTTDKHYDMCEGM